MTSQEQLITSVSRKVVASIAPHELPLFDITRHAYFRNPKQARRRQVESGGPLAFGVGEVAAVATPVVLIITTEVVKFVLEPVKTSLAELIGDLFKQLLKRSRPTSSAPAPTQSPAPAGLTPARLREARERGMQVARALKLPEDQAALVVDSVLMNLTLAPA